jgi:hypothetical protein
MTSPFFNAAEAAVKVDLCFQGCEEYNEAVLLPTRRKLFDTTD